MPEKLTSEVEEVRRRISSAQAKALRKPFPQVQKLKKEWTGRDGQKKSIVLDYISHAVVTDRLLEVDPGFSFEPLIGADGRPVIEQAHTSMGDAVAVWGRLTVLDSSVVEIGSGKDLLDAYSRCLCRCAMRRGVALDLWIKDDEFKAQPETRVEGGAGDAPVPRSWAKVQELVEKSCDNKEEAWRMFQAFVRAASYHLYGQTDSKALSPDQRKVMLQKAAGAAVWLAENTEPAVGDLYVYDIDDMRTAWASVVDGHALEIPDYVAPPPEPDPDDVPFGDV